MNNRDRLTVRPFTLPLTPAQFDAAIHRGHGRAMMHVQRHGIAGLEEQLLDACAHECRFDSDETTRKLGDGTYTKEQDP